MGNNGRSFHSRSCPCSCCASSGTGHYTPLGGCGALNAVRAIFPPCGRSTARSVAVCRGAPAIIRYEQGEGSRAKAARIQNLAVAQGRNKEARASTAQDQACTATSVRLVWRQDAVVKHSDGDAMCLSLRVW